MEEIKDIGLEPGLNGSMMGNFSLGETSNSSLLSDAMSDNASIAQKAFVGFTLGLLICLTLLGNGLVVAAVISVERLRSVANMFIVSLAIADITVAVLVMPVSLLQEVSPNLEISSIFCYFWISCDVTCCTASILHLCVISLDRYLAISSPFKYRKRMPRKRAAIMICAVWICSIAISFGPVFLGWFTHEDVHYELDIHLHSCGLINITRFYAVVSSSTSFFVPLIVMIIVYVKIYTVARGQVVEINKLYIACSVTDSPRGERRDRVRRRSRQIANDVKAIRTLGILMGVFIICWLPFFLMYIIMPFCNSCNLPVLVSSIITWLGYVNSFFNPCVYALMNKDFRNAFYKVLSCTTSLPESQIKTCFKKAICEKGTRTEEAVAL